MHSISKDYRNAIEYAICVVLSANAAKQLMPYPPHASVIKSSRSEGLCKLGAPNINHKIHGKHL